MKNRPVWFPYHHFNWCQRGNLNSQTIEGASTDKGSVQYWLERRDCLGGCCTCVCRAACPDHCFVGCTFGKRLFCLLWWSLFATEAKALAVFPEDVMNCNTAYMERTMPAVFLPSNVIILTSCSLICVLMHWSLYDWIWSCGVMEWLTYSGWQWCVSEVYRCSAVGTG